MTEIMAFSFSFLRARGLRGVLMGMAATQVLAACTMIPKYQRPQPPLAKTWPAYQTTGSATTSRSAYDLGWRDFFIDPRLQALMTIALRENRDLRSAAASVAEAQGTYDIPHSGLSPKNGASGGAMYIGPSNAGGLSFAPGLGAGSDIGTSR